MSENAPRKIIFVLLFFQNLPLLFKNERMFFKNRSFCIDIFNYRKFYSLNERKFSFCIKSTIMPVYYIQ